MLPIIGYTNTRYPTSGSTKTRVYVTSIADRVKTIKAPAIAKKNALFPPYFDAKMNGTTYANIRATQTGIHFGAI